MSTVWEQIVSYEKEGLFVVWFRQIGETT